MSIPQAKIAAFQKEILEWYSLHQRDLPWRTDRDPYHILVSEVMLQQTQVQRVIPKYESWLKAFPLVETLASASTRDVLQYWSGLGYNRRALFLQKFAQEVVEKFDGQIPQDEKILRTLPGIGEYTAKALLCFGFDKQVAVVDTNIRKVIAVRFFDGILPEEKVIQEIALQLLPSGKAYAWNQALMDYASAMLREHKIPIPRQSKFKDSDRYFRGQILKRLLEVHAQTEKELLTFFEEKKTPLLQARLEVVLEGLVKDKFIKIEKQYIFLT